MTFHDVAEQFQMLEGQDRLMILLDYAEQLPPLPDEYRELRDRGIDMVHECQSPVFLMVDVEDDVLRLHADVPEEAPTARGFTSILVEVFDGASVQTLLNAPADPLHELGLARLIGMQRTRGLQGIYAKLRNDAIRKA